MAFLPRAGRHAAGPVWPLPAVPAAWHRAEPLIKQAPVHAVPAGAPTEPGPRPRSLRGATRWAFRGGHVPVGCGDRRKTPWTWSPSPFLPTLGHGELLGWPYPICGLSFPIWEQEGAWASTRWLVGPVGPGPRLASLAGGPGSLRDGKQIRRGGCLGTPGSGYSHRARNEEGAARMPRPRCPDCTYFLATVQPQPRPPRAARHIL